MASLLEVSRESGFTCRHCRASGGSQRIFVASLLRPALFVTGAARFDFAGGGFETWNFRVPLSWLFGNFRAIHQLELCEAVAREGDAFR